MAAWGLMAAAIAGLAALAVLGNMLDRCSELRRINRILRRQADHEVERWPDRGA